MMIFKCTNCGWFLEEEEYNKIPALGKISCGKCARVIMKDFRRTYIPDRCCYIAKLVNFVQAFEPDRWGMWFLGDGEICLEYFKKNTTIEEGFGLWNKEGTPEKVLEALEKREWLK